MQNIDKVNIDAVILAGGKATRMSGNDKGLILFNGKPLISLVVDAIHGKVRNILISANRNHDQYKEFGTVVTDNLSNFQGPLAGISAALEETNSDYLLVVPCDSPFIASDLVERLAINMLSNDCDICVASDGSHLQPVFALLKTELRAGLLKFLQTGERKLSIWYDSNQTIKVDFSDNIGMFVNINSTNDLNKYSVNI